MISIVGHGLAFDFASFGFVLIWRWNQKKFGVFSFNTSIAGISWKMSFFCWGAVKSVIERFSFQKLRDRDKMPSHDLTVRHPGAAILPVPSLLTVRWGDHRLRAKGFPLPCPCKMRVTSVVQCGRFCTVSYKTSSTANTSHCKKC